MSSTIGAFEHQDNVKELVDQIAAEVDPGVFLLLGEGLQEPVQVLVLGDERQIPIDSVVVLPHYWLLIYFVHNQGIDSTVNLLTVCLRLVVVQLNG